MIFIFSILRRSTCTTTLEPILSKIFEKIQSLLPAVSRRWRRILPRRKIFFAFFIFCPRQIFSSKKAGKFFCSASAPKARGFASARARRNSPSPTLPPCPRLTVFVCFSKQKHLTGVFRKIYVI